MAAHALLGTELVDICANLSAGEHRLPCPRCNRGPVDRAFSLKLNDRGGAIWHCFRCSWSGAARGVDQSSQGQRHGVACLDQWTRSTARQGADYLAEVWNAAKPVAGVARDYLLARGCAIPPADGHLRYVPRLRHPIANTDGPALIALVTDIQSGAPMTLHRTWIRVNGQKADVDPPRMLLAGRPKRGGCIRLWPDDAVSHGLGIAEGIESALALAREFTPVWALIDAGNLAQFPLLVGIEALVMGVDHDPAGIRAARECAVRWSEREVRVVMPTTPGTDLADVARGAIE